MSAPPEQRGPPRSFDLDTLREALIQQRWTLVAFVAAVLLAVVVGTALTTPQFQAVAVIQLMPRAGQEIDVGEVVEHDAAGYLEARDRARTQIQIILSRAVRRQAAELYIAKGGKALGDLDEAAGVIRDGLTAGPREDTQLVEIRMLHPDAEVAADIANIVADVYCRDNLEWRTGAARETRVWLEGQQGSYLESLETATEAVLAFKERHDLVDIDEDVNDISSRMAALQRALGETTTKRVLLETSLAEHSRLLRKGDTNVLAGMFDDPALRAMSQEHAQVATKAAEVLARYGERHPEHQRAVQHIEKVEGLIATEVKRLVEAERSELTTLKNQQTEINVELDLVKAELLTKQRLQEEYSRLKLEEDRSRRLFSSLGERGAEVDLQAATQLNNVRVLDPAVPPGYPAKPNLSLNLVLGLGLGLAGGLGLVLLRHRLDETLRSPADVLRYLDLELLGVIPTLQADVPADERGLYSYNHPRSRHAESIRGVRAVLHKVVVPGKGGRLLVTSCLQGEGKTDTAVGLAVAFARLGARTVIIDGDLRLPRVHKVLGAEVSPGLADVLTSRRDPLKVVIPTKIPNLHLLPSGVQVDSPNDLLSIPSLRKVLRRLGEAYHVVIIDSPPAGLVSDALALAQETDGVVLVVRHGRVDRRMAVKTLEQLRQAGVTVLGAVLNDLPPSRLNKAYDSNYYDEGYRTPEQRTAAPVAPEPPGTPPPAEAPPEVPVRPAKALKPKPALPAVAAPAAAAPAAAAPAATQPAPPPPAPPPPAPPPPVNLSEEATQQLDLEHDPTDLPPDAPKDRRSSSS